QICVNQTPVRWTQSADNNPLNVSPSGDTSSATPPPAPPLTTDCKQNTEPKRVDQTNQVVAEETENMLKLIPFTITNIVLTIFSIVVYVWDVGSDVKLATHHYFNKHYCIALIGYGGNYPALAYMSRLSLIDCFMESAPQLVLQLYIVAKGDPQSTNIWTVVSVLGSLVALSMALVNVSLQGDVINKQLHNTVYATVYCFSDNNKTKYLDIKTKSMAETITSDTDNQICMIEMPDRNRQSADNNSPIETTSGDTSGTIASTSSPPQPPKTSANNNDVITVATAPEVSHKSEDVYLLNPIYLVKKYASFSPASLTIWESPLPDYTIYTNLFVALFSMATFFADIFTDIMLAIDYHRNHDYCYS
ncbi:unnamed protein product, partial [Medioppia subpectinata]